MTESTESKEMVMLPAEVQKVADLLRTFAHWHSDHQGFQPFARQANSYLASVLGRAPSDRELDAFIDDVRQ